MTKVRVPQSRFRRELNKWVRFIKNPLNVVYITRNKKDVTVFISPEQYANLINKD